MRHLIIDSEQAAILATTLEGVSAFLRARAARRDPAGFISKAYQLQDHKVANLKFQLAQGDIAKYEELSEAKQSSFSDIIEAFANAKQDHARALLYTQIHAFIAAQRVDRPQTSFAQHLLRGKK